MKSKITNFLAAGAIVLAFQACNSKELDGIQPETNLEKANLSVSEISTLLPQNNSFQEIIRLNSVITSRFANNIIKLTPKQRQKIKKYSIS